MKTKDMSMKTKWNIILTNLKAREEFIVNHLADLKEGKTDASSHDLMFATSSEWLQQN